MRGDVRSEGINCALVLLKFLIICVGKYHFHRVLILVYRWLLEFPFQVTDDLEELLCSTLEKV